jgi:hypothetical protein
MTTREHPAGALWAQITSNHILLYAALAATVLALALFARKVRNVARSEKPDETLSTVGMLIGLGWSGEAMWIIGTQLLHLPIPLLALLLFVLEVNLATAMIRAKRHHRLHDHPGSYGTTAWSIAAAMALIAAFASHSPAEAALRIAIPLLVTKTWWDGMVGAGTRKLAGATTWRWTPRRLLLWAGAIEPGERDVEQVNRDRLAQQMTRLEFRRQNTSGRAQRRATAKLTRLSLTADDAIIGEVRQQVARARWYTVTPLTVQPIVFGSTAGAGSQGANPGAKPGANGGANPPAKPPANGGAKSPANGRKPAHPMADDPNPSIRALARTFAKHPAKTNPELAKLAGVSEGTANRYLPKVRAAAVSAEPVTAGVNGHDLNLTKEPK